MDTDDLPEKSLISPYLEPKKIKATNKYGVKYDRTIWQIPKHHIELIGTEMFALPYDGEDPSLQGYTNLEASWLQVARKATRGDIEALKFYVERTLGKAKQQIEQTTTTLNINDFLKTLELEVPTQRTVIDITPHDQDNTDNSEYNWL